MAAAAAAASSAAAAPPVPIASAVAPAPGAPRSSKKPKKPEKEDIGGIPTNSLVLAKWRDGSWRRATLLHKQHIRDGAGEPTGRFNYYVHYDDFNRRMDTWVNSDNVKEDPDAALREAEAERKEKEDVRVEKRQREDGGTEEIATFLEEQHGEAEGMDEAALREHEEVTKVKNVNFVEIGRHRMETWYFSPLPKELWQDEIIDTLYFHEHSLRFFKHKAEMLRHAAKWPLKHPPGDEVYRHQGMAVFELDGAKEKEYCQNLSYLAKFFLDHKTLQWDVDPFLFYVFTEYDEFGYHFVGYYSKEKYCDAGYNLACILALPCFQRRGFGRFIIQFSYELSRKERRVGSPEKPLSDLGQLSYRAYWTWVLFGVLRRFQGPELSIMDLVRITSIKPEDVMATLQYHGLIKYYNGTYVLCTDPALVEAKFQKYNNKKGPVVDPSKLHWAPYPITVKRDKWTIRAKLQARTEEEM
ncbi:hypothetical protein FNF27_01528 [Cafeteria roenbergensis]|uniref:histone acetyltransferase n=1 Tax=Cafeteria roenbergensis TaxID=33653 RepID=A0A5A8CN95_CAFRO|nr:hypothetical protein FNF29_07415 [Cafeteria roenbergensis]KAA0154593.1 hypothetical protein FNF31_06248 [Cafeteria roenbergensis]KAA0167017.1 hypothetical protein FNF28_02940 [Cafeteria roenbergensis]KAA0177199.1 hypothetical protein FNF27_01528 [Cafeteria roenbergensis]|mmetsp:Transcript_7595/g.30062  ORF Transcript_7595/g.30062 Transcript_7595/m.30062 type:complete len:469 (-) Transcript_7595:94-1500(-)|eukprot:KAA0147347.1 hypothetical protein FNF29_07415 [Cafeteria roenbergensis]